MKYCESIYATKRWKTRQVMVGQVGVGGDHPIKIQSMTTSNTRDVDATVDQIIRLADSGCDIVRITVQGMKEADACESIKNKLIQKNYTIPIVADIHFFPPAAMRVVDFVEKVRVNPGNFVDKRASFKVIEYSDSSYLLELEKIEEKFTPLIHKCKSLKRAMRIGTNHGSLSDRIMNRYGDTPQGMVESALEFARLCRKNDYHDIIFSMKSSNPQVMILAYRLLVAEMMKLGWNYPLHLGVTEAGEGEDGRVKSAMGIGALLLDGIGDTIRVSLTEDPWFEIDPCQRLRKMAEARLGKGIDPFEEKHRHIENITRRDVQLPKNFALHRDGSVFISLSNTDLEDSNVYSKLGCDIQFERPKIKINSPDEVFLRELPNNSVIQQKIQHLFEAGVGVILETGDYGLQLHSLQSAIQQKMSLNSHERFIVKIGGVQSIGLIIRDEPISAWEAILEIKPDILILNPLRHRLHFCRRFFDWLQDKNIKIPVILNFQYHCSKEDLIIQAAAEFGSLLCDGLGDGIWIDAPYDHELLRLLSFNILQAARMRTSKTDFISCPSCGRTLFDLQDVTKRIRGRTAHLPGVKIAIMGCIVNGPGEMADADFGYVGSKPGKIDLYVGKKCVEKDIDFSEADDRLVSLIKTHGRWNDPL